MLGNILHNIIHAESITNTKIASEISWEAICVLVKMAIEVKSYTKRKLRKSVKFDILNCEAFP